MRAAPLAISGLLALILAELMKILLPPLLTWAAGILLIVLKIGVAVVGLGIGAGALALTVFLIRRANRRGDPLD